MYILKLLSTSYLLLSSGTSNFICLGRTHFYSFYYIRCRKPVLSQSCSLIRQRKSKVVCLCKWLYWTEQVTAGWLILYCSYIETVSVDLKWTIW